MRPFVKWAGGKKQILQPIIDKINKSISCDNKDYTFIEPFVGGGVVFINLKHDKVIINDLNEELITAYRVIRDNPQGLMNELDDMAECFADRGLNYYTEVREQDRDPEYRHYDDVLRAARMIFLNKTCFNGLYRVNSEGYFNTPMGRNSTVTMYEEKNINALSNYLNRIDPEHINIMCGSYKQAMARAKMGDIVYVDPPYDYTENDGFTKYQKEGFSLEDLRELKTECDKCIEKGAYVILSNNDTKKVREIFNNDPLHDYQIYFIEHLDTKRIINCKGTLRNTGKEIIIWGIPFHFLAISNMNTILSFIRIKNIVDLMDEEKLCKNKQLSLTYVEKVISSMRYFGLIDSQRKLTEDGKKVRGGTRNHGAAELRNVLLKNKIISDVYIYNINNRNQKKTKDEIAEMIKENDSIKDSVATKRARIIAEIVDWCMAN